MDASDNPGPGAGRSAFGRAFDAFYSTPALLLVATMIFWAANAVAGQIAKGEISPMQLVLFRWVGVMAFMWPLFGGQVRAHWRIARPSVMMVLAMAILGFTGFNTLFYLAALSTTAVNVGILQGSVPVFVMLGAFIAHGTRVTGMQAVGVTVTLGGVVLVATHGEPLALLELALNRGDLFMLAACSLYAAYAVLLKNRPQMPGVVFFTLLAPVAMITAIPGVLVEAVFHPAPWPTMKGWILVVLVAIFPSCLAQIFFLRGVDLIGPGRAGVYNNLVPVFAAILAVVILGEAFATYHAIALVLVLGGIALAQRKHR